MAERDEAVEPGKEKARRGILAIHINPWWEGMKQREPGFPQQCPATGQEAMAQMETHEIPSEQKETLFFAVRVVKRWHRLPGEAGEMFRPGPGLPAPADPA